MARPHIHSNQTNSARVYPAIPAGTELDDKEIHPQQNGALCEVCAPAEEPFSSGVELDPIGSVLPRPGQPTTTDKLAAPLWSPLRCPIPAHFDECSQNEIGRAHV